jgi:hypothetical protein
LHLEAYKNITEKFDVWKRMANVSLRRYLAEIQKNSLTGEGAKEVIKHLIRDENEECHRTK